MKKDFHVHTKFSCDGLDTLEEIINSAVSKGLTHICITEHVDLNPNDYGFNFYDYVKYSDEILRQRESHPEITIYKGIEFGEPHIYKREFEEELKKDYDFILGSIHWLDDTFFGDQKLLQKYERTDIMQRYYEEMYKMIEYGNFDIVAHFDFPSRYLGKVSHNADVKDILKLMVNKDMILEINTSGLRKGYLATMPGFDIVNEYVELGGRKVSFGSDAHSSEEVYKGIEESLNSFMNFHFLDKLFML